MNIVTLDFETFYTDDYKLKKMTTEAYIRDPRFEVHGCAMKGSAGTRWYDAAEFKDFCESPVRSNGFKEWAVLCHHAQFDGLIVSHHYGIRPAVWLDTLSMARLMLGNHVSVSLDSVAKHFGLAAKTVPYNLFKGKHWHELDAPTQKLVADGACWDVELTWQIFNKLMTGER